MVRYSYDKFFPVNPLFWGEHKLLRLPSRVKTTQNIDFQLRTFIVAMIDLQRSL